MTHIAEGSANPNGEGGRTVTNGSVYDARKVYEMTAVAILDEVQSVYGTGEVERTGNVVTETRVYHVVAESEDLARAFFARRWGGAYYRHTLMTVKPLFVIDGEIVVGNK